MTEHLRPAVHEPTAQLPTVKRKMSRTQKIASLGVSLTAGGVVVGLGLAWLLEEGTPPSEPIPIVTTTSHPDRPSPIRTSDSRVLLPTRATTAPSETPSSPGKTYKATAAPEPSQTSSSSQPLCDTLPILCTPPPITLFQR